MNKPAVTQRGDRNFREVERLMGFCPKCKMVRRCHQTVDKHTTRGESYGILRHYCKVCSLLLHSQKYPIPHMSDMMKLGGKYGRKPKLQTRGLHRARGR